MFKIRKPILSHAHAPRPRPFYPTYDGRKWCFPSSHGRSSPQEFELSVADSADR